jgi:hypothetical protein
MFKFLACLVPGKNKNEVPACLLILKVVPKAASNGRFFQVYIQRHRRLLESRNKLSEEGYWKEFHK